MGAKGSKHSNCLAIGKATDHSNGCSHEICNCFLHDTNVKSNPVVSLSSQRWDWTKQHEAALQAALRNNFQVSTEVAKILRLFAYSGDDDESFYVAAYQVKQEREYSSSSSQLCKKTLCPRWYASHFEMCPAFDIAVVNSDQNMLSSLVSSLSGSSLPALKRDHGEDEAIRRITMFVDSNLFTLKVQCAASVEEVAESPHVCMVLIRDDRDIENLNQIYSSPSDLSLLSQHVIVVQCNSSATTKKGYAAIRQFCNRFNICYYKADSALTELSDDDDVDGDDDNGKAQQLFALAIKHYWFKHSGVP